MLTDACVRGAGQDEQAAGDQRVANHMQQAEQNAISCFFTSLQGCMRRSVAKGRPLQQVSDDVPIS